MIEQATAHISSTKRVQADVGEGPGLMSTVEASDSMRRVLAETSSVADPVTTMSAAAAYPGRR